MKKEIYRVVTRSDDGNVAHDGRKYYATGNLHTLPEAESKQEEWEKDSPSRIQASSNLGKTWKNI